MNIPVIVSAKNEERALGACLTSLRNAAVHPELTFVITVVLDDTTDGSAAIAREHGVRVLRASGGKVAAQRVGNDPGAPFNIFADADIVVAPDTLRGLAEHMLREPRTFVAHPRKVPAPSASRSRLARACHLYNRERGYAEPQPWFSGKLFAIRRWHVPTRGELAARIARLEDDPFYAYARGLQIDDIYLSQSVLHAHGASAIVEVSRGCVHFRAPETFGGVYAYYRRMRRELERVRALFPEFDSRAVRTLDRARLARATRAERALFTYFQHVVAACKVLYAIDRAYHRRATRSLVHDWKPIAETKAPFGDAIDL